MAFKPVLRMGEQSLLERSQEIEEFGSRELEQLIDDMWDTMAKERGAGLAAPQIGVNLRVVIFGYQSNPRYPEAPAVPETVLRPLLEVRPEYIAACFEEIRKRYRSKQHFFETALDLNEAKLAQLRERFLD